jgi:hypothetical protein
MRNTQKSAVQFEMKKGETGKEGRNGGDYSRYDYTVRPRPKGQIKASIPHSLHFHM